MEEKKQEKACGGDNFYQTSQCISWIAGISAIAVRRETFRANGADVQPALRSDPWSWQSGHGEGRNILISVVSLKPKYKGRTNQLCTCSRSQSLSACCGTVYPVSCLQSKLIHV